MQRTSMFEGFFDGSPIGVRPGTPSRKVVIGIILMVALLAFEAFNFDTTRFALDSILGGKEFLRISWAMILAIAFCAIDFAGLARMFTPERGSDEPKAIWFLMGAWLLGATMNAVMTWWAVSLTLLSHDFGNEVLGRATLLKMVPVFVAGLVLLTRILFIGAFSVAGEHILDLAGDAAPAGRRRPAVMRNQDSLSLPQGMPVRERQTVRAVEQPITSRQEPMGRTHNHPPKPGSSRVMPSPMQAKGGH